MGLSSNAWSQSCDGGPVKLLKSATLSMNLHLYPVMLQLMNKELQLMAPDPDNP